MLPHLYLYILSVVHLEFTLKCHVQMYSHLETITKLTGYFEEFFHTMYGHHSELAWKSSIRQSQTFRYE